MSRMPLVWLFVSVITVVCLSGCRDNDEDDNSVLECNPACEAGTVCEAGECVALGGDGDKQEADVEVDGFIDGDTDEEVIVELPLPFIVDEQGRAMILHGVNVDYGVKGNPAQLPVIPEDEPIRLSRDLGFNLVRLLLVWEGVEPEPGEIDQSYLDQIETRVDQFAAAGMNVVLDMHQDVYARRFCCDGAPEWAIRDDGESFAIQPQWFLNYFQPAVVRAFDNFWAYDQGEHQDLQDHYANMWKAVVERFKDHPAVLGYDLMNEPHPGSDFDAGEALGLGAAEDSPSPAFDRDKLQPFYQRIINVIRQVDEEGWIFFETRYGAPGNGSPSFIEGLVDPRSGAPRLAYFPHLYSVSLENNQSYNPEVDKTIENWETNRALEVDRENWPLLIGEWGLDPAWEKSALFTSKLLAMADRRMAGWAYWSWDPGGWSFLDSDFTERDWAGMLARVYPQKISGRPEFFSFDPDARLFSLTYSDREGVSGATEIYIPASRHYPEGWTLEVSDPDGSWSMEWDAELEIVRVTTTPDSDGHTLTIRPSQNSD